MECGGLSFCRRLLFALNRLPRTFFISKLRGGDRNKVQAMDAGAFILPPAEFSIYRRALIN